MLDVARCRELLGTDPSLTDKNISALCAHLRDLAEIAIDAYLALPASARPAHYADVIAVLPDQIREHLEERAAIREFDGDLSRTDAERATLASIVPFPRRES